ncbi:hypothetical protein SKAU_G00408300 [Synaphobranchus kaupii]|uniref:Uncharacterized protein n=1 Tax=Synaphobranchus kaupii TaxID=118154 RepID=A0A9Q1ID28_SYNKA|nr:hypothetical protein SKAU_G00408300 [Synaphobranchus kaupii]
MTGPRRLSPAYPSKPSPVCSFWSSAPESPQSAADSTPVNLTGVADKNNDKSLLSNGVWRKRHKSRWIKAKQVDQPAHPLNFSGLATGKGVEQRSPRGRAAREPARRQANAPPGANSISGWARGITTAGKEALRRERGLSRTEPARSRCSAVEPIPAPRLMFLFGATRDSIAFATHANGHV